jgi:hypothetical protein
VIGRVFEAAAVRELAGADASAHLRPVRYMLAQWVLCDPHAAALEAADGLPRVGEWQGRRWLGVPAK